ncbi:hypothetical protein GQS_02255 [Thermococcus sp. 4557]|uniref:hypothetical protein n=1 Tax=Thermococcus sp. (strain CGMCC 1.5172 / 4557) TaxID=1042877 RepID=UPI000219EDBC|nr:hypothetical protein [Thermococcus sp. 4557]AEK72352.1 hypothetical protein GQS_02255 [Thermococcus sp. 4557]
MPEERREPPVDEESIEKLGKAVDELKELKEQVPGISAAQIDEIIAALVEVKQALLPKVDMGKVFDAVQGTETEIHLKFTKLTLDGEITLKIVPLRKE